MEKVNFGETEVELKVFNKKDFLKLGRVHVSACFSFPVKNNSLLLTKNPRGWDFLGGHTEDGESPYQTMIRESYEEAGIQINEAEVIGAIEVHHPQWTENSKYPKTSYHVFYKTDNYEVLEFNKEFECEDRHFFYLVAIEEKHHNLLNSHKELLSFI